MSQTEYIETTAEKIKDKIIDSALFFNSHGKSPDVLFNLITNVIKEYEETAVKQLENRRDMTKLTS